LLHQVGISNYFINFLAENKPPSWFIWRWCTGCRRQIAVLQ